MVTTTLDQQHCSETLFWFVFIGSKIRLVTLDLAIDLLKGMVLGSDGRSYLADTHFAEVEGIKEESTLLLRNFYKVLFELFSAGHFVEPVYYRFDLVYLSILSWHNKFEGLSLMKARFSNLCAQQLTDMVNGNGRDFIRYMRKSTSGTNHERCIENQTL